MASGDKSEDEILGLDTTNSSLNLSTDDKVDEDISCIDEDMLLLNSPSPTPAHSTADSSTVLKSGNKPTSSPDVHNISDNDDELEIIDDVDDDDDVEEVSDFDEDTEGSTDKEELPDEEDSDESLEFDSAESSTFMDGKISIFHTHGAFFLWNADDVQMLREECRIVGKLTGSLPRAPRQNNHLGLPLQLMPEEAKLLVDIDAAIVVEEEQVSDKTLSIREAAFQNVRATNYKIQQNLYKESRKEDVQQRLKDIIAGKKAKKRKLEEDSKSDQGATSSTNSKASNESVENKDIENGEESESVDHLTVEDIISETKDTSEKHSLVQIFTENPWKRTFHPYIGWNYPSTDKEVLRYSVFKDLWSKGYYLTSGVKFGGDFLVYPGDPARFHSHYVAICKDPMEELPCLDIISFGRLASNVRKTTLLCSMGRNRKVFYTSLQWTGMS